MGLGLERLSSLLRNRIEGGTGKEKEEEEEEEELVDLKMSRLEDKLERRSLTYTYLKGGF